MADGSHPARRKPRHEPELGAWRGFRSAAGYAAVAHCERAAAAEPAGRGWSGYRSVR